MADSREGGRRQNSNILLFTKGMSKPLDQSAD
jgi:hypothetical protein